MKRYDPDYLQLMTMEERPDGSYYLASEVDASMIPRPNAEEARKAVDELISAATCFEAAYNNPLFEDYKEESIADLQRTKAAVLALMGVENA